jgi:hypothetical protein
VELANRVNFIFVSYSTFKGGQKSRAPIVAHVSISPRDLIAIVDAPWSVGKVHER